MLKDQYILVQDGGMCTASGNFTVYQRLPDISQAWTLNKVNNEMNQPNLINSGQFKQQKSCKIFNCCSCHTINQLTLNVYGQIISKAHMDACCNFMPCLISQQLIVTTSSEILIGKVIKQTCFSQRIFSIFDSNIKLRYYVIKKKCFCASYLPRTLRCDDGIIYEIVDDSHQVVGNIVNNKLQGPFQAFFTCRDSFQVNMPSGSNDKDKILLMNAVVYLDIAKHEFF